MIDKVVSDWFVKKHINKVNESAVDIEQKVLSKKIWTKDQKLKPEIKKFIQDNFDKLLSRLKIDKERVKSSYIWGSLTGHQYNDFTDLDCQIVVDYSTEGENAQEVWKKDISELRSFIPNGYNFYKDLTHPINYYIQLYDGENLYPFSLDPLYDFEKDKWIRKRQIKIKIKDRTVFELVSSWSRKIDLDFGELRRDVIDLKFLNEGVKDISNLKVKEGYIPELKNQKMREIIYDLESLSYTLTSVRNWRFDNQVDLAEKHKDTKETTTIEVTDKNFHNFAGVIVWKLLSKFGTITVCGGIKQLYNKFKEKEITEDELIKELDKQLVPEGTDLWKH